jgi:hypothetical protein
VTAFGYAFPKTTGRFRNALSSRFPTCTHEDSPFHPLSLRPQLMHHRIIRGWFSFLCQGPGSRPTSFTDVRVSGAVGRLSSDQKARQPSSLSRMLPLDCLYIFFQLYIFFGKPYLKKTGKRFFYTIGLIFLSNVIIVEYRYCWISLLLNFTFRPPLQNKT